MAAAVAPPNQNGAAGPTRSHSRPATTLQGLLTAGEQLELLGAACVQARGAAPQPAIAIRRVRASGELVTLLVSEPEMAPRVIDTDVVGWARSKPE